MFLCFNFQKCKEPEMWCFYVSLSKKWTNGLSMICRNLLLPSDKTSRFPIWLYLPLHTILNMNANLRPHTLITLSGSLRASYWVIPCTLWLGVVEWMPRRQMIERRGEEVRERVIWELEVERAWCGVLRWVVWVGWSLRSAKYKGQKSQWSRYKCMVS